MRSRLILFAGAVLLLTGVWQVGAQATPAVAYSGRLSESNQPANGLFDLQFRLFDSAEGGSAIGNTNLLLAVPVTNGAFTVSLDASSWPFDGARWLEVSVRSNAAPGGFVTLSPRQAVAAVPQALFALQAGRAGLASQLAPGTLIVGNGAGLTNLNGYAIVPQTIDRSRIHPATDALYREGSSNRITVINVKDYGAFGDGIHDDTLAISNAWAAFLVAGGTLYFPPGIYLDSGSHSNTAFVSSEPYFRDGRLILGLGSAIWVYTGSSRLLYFHNSAPDIEGIEFRGNPEADACIYVTSVYGKFSIRNCFFYNWTKTKAGALVMDEADGIVLDRATFSTCNIGIGCGYRCHNLSGNILAAGCDLAMAVGVPTESFSWGGESYNLDLNLFVLYSNSGLAVDNGASGLSLRGYFWWCTNSVMIGQIPGISTNLSPNVSLAVEHTYFRNAAGVRPPIQLHGPLVSGLRVTQCRFDSAPGSPPLIKSFLPSADRTAITWQDNYQTPPQAAIFEESTGVRLAEASQLQTRLMNRGLGLYNSRNLATPDGSGYLLDALDSSRTGPVARIGVSSGSDAAGFLGGLLVRFDGQLSRPAVTVTNAELVVATPGSVPGPSSPGQPGAIRWDSDYIYICVGTNLWKRANLSSW